MYDGKDNHIGKQRQMSLLMYDGKDHTGKQREKICRQETLTVSGRGQAS